LKSDNNDKRFRALVEATSDWIWEVDANAVYTYSNPKVRELLGYEPEDIIGKTPFDLMPTDEAERVSAKFSEIVQAQRAFSNTENINRHRDGHEVILETSGVPVFDEQGQFCGYRGVDRDITARKQTEATLQANENHYRWLVESAQALPWEMDISTLRFTYVGPQAEAMLGYSQAEWYEEGFWLKYMHPDDREWAPRFCQESIGRRENHDFEYRIYAKDGRLLWIRDSVNVIDNIDIIDGAVRSTILRGFMFDVTDQKQKEDALALSQQRLLESQQIAQLGHWDWDIINNTLFWSDEHYRLCGVAPGTITPGYEVFLDFIHPDDRDKWVATVNDAFSKNNYNMDHRIVLANGEVRYVHGQGQVYYDDTNQPLRMIGTIQDISERKYLENALTAITHLSSSMNIVEYCRSCVENIVRIYNTPYAFIGIFSDDSKQRIKTQAVWANGQFVDNFEYELKGTPCADVLDRKAELIARDAARLYPEDTMLVDMSVESYFGAPMISASGHKMGIIAVLDINPMEIISWTEPVLDLFAQRIASYIEGKQASEKIASSEAELRNIFHNMQDTFYRTDNEGRVIKISDSVEQLLGYKIDDLIGMKIGDFYIDPDRRQVFLEQLDKGNGSVQDFSAGLRRKDGSVAWVATNAQYYKDSSGNILGVEGVTRDMCQHYEAELQMRKMSSALEQTADLVMVTDAQGRVEYVNPSFERTTGYRREDVLGKTPQFLKSGKQSESFYRNLWDTILSGEVFFDVMVNCKKSGDLYYEEKSITPIRNDQGEITSFVATGRDITERMENEERLSFMAHHDALTKLPNRILFMDRLKQSLAHARRYTKKVAVLFIDLDRFKNINDTLGHETGDLMLTQVADRLRKNIRQEDTIARLGGDEFAVLLTDIETEQCATVLAKKILQSLEAPLELNQRELFISASIGVSLFPNDGEDAGTLLKNADIAMYRAKDLGKNNHQFYSTDMSARAFQSLTMESSLRHALEREEFVLFYQPQVDIESNRIVGVEALIRWQHPDLGLVAPNDFISLLEETGLIIPVGYWVIASACRQMKLWHEMGFPELMMSINISSRQFNATDFIKTVEGIINDIACSPEMIEMEITESVLMENQSNTITALEMLEAIGFKIAIDDFGTGYSSLSYLRRFNIDTLKVDRSFVRDVIDDADDAAITSAIIAMAQSLKLKVIAEGVETQQQLDFLKKCQCTLIQGYLFSRPLPADGLTELLQAQEK